MNLELFGVPLSRRPSCFYNFTRARVGIYKFGKVPGRWDTNL